jgi:hypothetical protein
MAQTLEKCYQAVDPRFSGEILGSYRRGEQWCSDVDLVIRHKDYEKVSFNPRCCNFSLMSGQITGRQRCQQGLAKALP